MRELLSQLVSIFRMFWEMFKQLWELEHPIFGIAGCLTTAAAIIIAITNAKRRR